MLGLIGGLSVLAAAYWQMSVWFVAAGVGAPCLAVFLVAWSAAETAQREQLRQHAKAGLVAGVAGLVAYDLARWTVVWTTGVEINPFEAFPVFGELLVGTRPSDSIRWVAGFGFHVFNGLGFAVFYSIFWGRKGMPAGVAWAFLLEVATLLVYPGWLDIRAKGEFTVVSIAGHLCYGLTIGYVAKRLTQQTS